jgi:hypothetical protein
VKFAQVLDICQAKDEKARPRPCLQQDDCQWLSIDITFKIEINQFHAPPVRSKAHLRHLNEVPK